MNFSFHPEADEELIEAAVYYEACEPGLELDFSREVYAAIRNALDYPSMWPTIEEDVRRCLVYKNQSRHGTGVWKRGQIFPLDNRVQLKFTVTPTSCSVIPILLPRPQSQASRPTRTRTELISPPLW